MPTPHDADPRHRLGQATELIRQIGDPHSALAIGWTVYGPEHVRARCNEWLAAEETHRRADGLEPTVYADAARVPLRRVIANQVPWPAAQLCDLWPGDGVDHDTWGPGTVNGFNDDDYADHLELLTAGTLLVDFGRAGPQWVAANELTRTSENNPAY